MSGGHVPRTVESLTANRGLDSECFELIASGGRRTRGGRVSRLPTAIPRQGWPPDTPSRATFSARTQLGLAHVGSAW